MVNIINPCLILKTTYGLQGLKERSLSTEQGGGLKHSMCDPKPNKVNKIKNPLYWGNQKNFRHAIKSTLIKSMQI